MSYKYNKRANCRQLGQWEWNSFQSKTIYIKNQIKIKKEKKKGYPLKKNQ